MTERSEPRSALIVLAHPERRSFNGQLADRCAATLEQEGHTAVIADLYGEDFDPVEGPKHYSVRRNPALFVPMSEQRHSSDRGELPEGPAAELARLHAADIVVLQFPLWWYGPPAILKGWFDRVMVLGEAYSGTKRYENGVFRGRDALVSVTTGSSESTYRSGRDGNIDRYLWPVHFTLHYLGFNVWPPCVNYGISGDSIHPSGSDAREQLVVAENAFTSHLATFLAGKELTQLRFDASADEFGQV